MQTLNKPRPEIRAIARLVPPSGNLVQGQNETTLNPALASALTEVVASGLNHYSFFEGVQSLRKAVAEKIRIHNNVAVDPDARPFELIVTSGGTGALVPIARAHLSGASALVFEPYYPYHERILREFGGRVDSIRLHGDDLALDLDEMRDACSRGVRESSHPLKAIILSTPGNPTGRVFTRVELEAIIQCAEEFDLLIISDEVYEHFAAAPGDHISIASLPGGFHRTITVNSFSKSWAISGWRIGFAYGPGKLINPVVPHGNVFYVCAPTPLQEALGRVLLADPAYYDRLRESFVIKRRIIAEALERTGFKPYSSRSNFYIWARIPEGFGSATEVNEILLRDAGIAGVPGSAFVQDPDDDFFMRFCIARKDSMLRQAAGRLVAALG
ncbi:MAG TPA: pyridoxal phosphate-dependent aminotransferase [Blastocatellia bacterium]